MTENKKQKASDAVDNKTTPAMNTSDNQSDQSKQKPSPTANAPKKAKMQTTRLSQKNNNW